MTKIIIDCDPGHDDMVAIMLACASEEIELLGVTTVAGNQTGDKTFNNALRILTFLKEDIPVARGADAPLLRKLVTAPHIHGETGLDGIDLPASGMKGADEDAVDFIVGRLRTSADKITLVPVGPLTNIAMVLLKAPQVRAKIERIVLMGGALRDSNVTPAAEFNIYVDPEAAKIVFESGIPITMIGLDVTKKALLSSGDIEGMIAEKGVVSSKVGPMLKHFAESIKKRFGVDGATVHDALAVAAVVDPGVVRTKALNVRIETASELTRGATVADVYGVTGLPLNVDVALEVDTRKFVKMLVDAVRTLDKKLA